MKLLHLDVVVDRDEAGAGAKLIAKRVRQDWSDETLLTKTFTDGITNKLIGVKCAGQDEQSMILVRIHGNNTELIIDRQRELKTIQVLVEAGCAAPLYCTFENGLCYGYVPGQPVNQDMVMQPQIAQLIVKTMVQFHTVQGDFDSREPMLFPTMENWLQLLPARFEDQAKQEGFLQLRQKLDIGMELEKLKARLLQLSAPVVFCHNDLLLGNVIYNAVEGKVSFIDFEYGAFNFRGFDIADHFCEYAGTENVDYSRYPGQDYQLIWLRMYLEEVARSKGETDVSVSDADVQQLYVEVNQFALASHLFWAIWALIQAANSDIDFDYMGYSHIRCDEFLNRRDDFLSLSAK